MNAFSDPWTAMTFLHTDLPTRPLRSFKGNERLPLEPMPLLQYIVKLGTPLREMKEKGDFLPVGPMEILDETHMILLDLDLERTAVDSAHVTNNLWLDRRLIYRGVGGTLPEDKEKMIGHIGRTMNLLEGSEGGIWDTNRMLLKGYPVGL